jgi:hypothetical protein
LSAKWHRQRAIVDFAWITLVFALPIKVESKSVVAAVSHSALFEPEHPPTEMNDAKQLTRGERAAAAEATQAVKFVRETKMGYVFPAIAPVPAPEVEEAHLNTVQSVAFRP